MNDILKFTPELADLVKADKKWTTWRLFYEDKKHLKPDDTITLACRTSATEIIPFGKAKITSIKETTLGTLTPEDEEGHEPFRADEEMYQRYEQLYKKPVNPSTAVMVIKFKMI